MKYYLIKPNQITSGTFMRPTNPTVIIPKAMMANEDPILGNNVSYDDVLQTVDSELDLVFVNSYNRPFTQIVDNDNKICLNKVFNIVKIEDTTVEALGYTSELVKSANGAKVIIHDSSAELYEFNSFVNGTIKKDNLIKFIDALFCVDAIESLDFRAEYKTGVDADGYNDSHHYRISKFDFDKEDLEESFEDKRDKMSINRLHFSKLFTRDEAEALLKVIKDNVKKTSININKVRLEDLYELV